MANGALYSGDRGARRAAGGKRAGGVRAAHRRRARAMGRGDSERGDQAAV